MEGIHIITGLFILFFSVIAHEFCHGYIAYLNGDDTARLLGRLTFNPIPHIDPIGTLILPVLLFLSTRGAFVVGWAKPVPINPFNFRDHDRGMLSVGIAGPLSNILLGTVFALLSRNLTAGFIRDVFLFGGMINFILAFFNLIPIPPLDGSRILSVFLPGNIRYRYEQLEKVGFILVFAFLLLGGFDLVVPLVKAIVNALAGS